MSDLQRLLLEQKEAGLPFERMAANARRNGRPDMNKQYIRAVARGEIKRPSLHKLAGLAAGLPGVTEAQVREAAGRSAGTHVEHNVDYRTSTLLNFVGELSPTMRSRWFRLATVIAEELAAEESVPPQTVVVSEATPDEHTRRVLQNKLEDIASRTPPPRQARRQDP